VVEGPARVVKSVGQMADVRDGEILVCGSTSPAWAPIFSRISATVTDIGGVMSHAAIVCREYGLPAVVGTGRATSQIRTGQLVSVDGSTGTVTILD
jgi:pyruvate,water dikinase